MPNRDARPGANSGLIGDVAADPAAGIHAGSSQRVAQATALICALCVAGFTVYLCGRPLDTGDLWWHLSLGEAFSERGLDLDGDPLVHTALPDSPRTHEWLFQITLHAVKQTTGFYGLRALHALWGAGLLVWVFALLRRSSGSVVLASCGAIAFVLLAWYRLFQLRPDLVSITACLALYGLALSQRGAISRVAMGTAALGMVLWANSHPVFGVGLALLVAALVGCALERGLRHWLAIPPDDAGARSAGVARQLGIVFALCLGASAINPDGFAQHLHFFQLGGGAEAFTIGDEWVRFNPFAWGHYRAGSVSLPTFVATDVVIALFLLTAAMRGRALFRVVKDERSEALRGFDCIGFGLGLAAIVAMLAAVRFLWLGIFPILYVCSPGVLVGSVFPGRRGNAATLIWASVVACVAMAVAYPQSSGFARDASATRGYFSTPYAWHNFPVRSTRFLATVGAEGNLFNSYGSGGFLGYWLAPKMKVFVDSRLESPPEIYREYALVNRQLPEVKGEAFIHILERRGIDFFVGTGLPTAPPPDNWAQFTTEHLGRAPGWLLVYRAYDEAVYARLNRRNLGNLKRIAEYYAKAGVPFDAKAGFDITRVIRSKPTWAIANGLLPLSYRQITGQLVNGTPERRLWALDLLGTSHLLAGDYVQALEFDRRNHGHRPGHKRALRRLVYDLLQLERGVEAHEMALKLLAIDPADSGSQRFVEVAAQYVQAREQLGDTPHAFQPALRRSIATLPIVSSSAERLAIEQRYFPPQPLQENER